MKFFKSVLISLVFLAVGAGCCSSIKPVPPIPDNVKNLQIARHIQDATVALVMGPSGEKSAYCAGIWVDEKHILTAAHCAEVFGRTLFDISEEEEYDSTGDLVVFVNYSDLKDGELPQDFAWVGVVQKIDKKRDLALIQNISQTSKHHTARLSRESIDVGEVAHIMGHPIGLLWTYTRGTVAAIRNLQGPMIAEQRVSAKVLQVSAPIWVGNSGGGAFNSNGELIGVCSWIALRAPSVGFLIHRDEIKSFIESD
jgi:hypothetical protein